MRRAVTVRDDYDFVLIDCPPSLGLITINMLAAADALLIPLQCELLRIGGIEPAAEHRTPHPAWGEPTLGISGVLLTMYDAR